MVKPQFELKNASLVLNERLILKNLNIRIPMHGLTHIDGENGSGKTCLIALLLKLYTVSTGEQRIAFDKKRLCYIPAHSVFFDTERVKTALFFLARLYATDITAHLHHLDLNYDDIKHKKISELSSGMKQKLHLLPLFLDANDYFFLDELSQNLDHKSLLCVINRINTLLTLGKTVVVIDHNPALIPALNAHRKEHFLCANTTVTNISC